MTQKPLKLPPHSKESEMIVLGCMLTSINSLNVSAEALSEHDFYFAEHKAIFRALREAYRHDKPADVHLISEELKRQNALESSGGVIYLTELVQYAGTSAYIEEYVEIVKSKAMLREIIRSAQVIEKEALEGPKDVLDSLDRAQQFFFQIGQSARSNSGILISDILSGSGIESKTSFLKTLEERQERYAQKSDNDAGITGIPTYFTDLDHMINGLNNSNFMILAARPAMGKTALAINIAENVCFKNNLPVGVFSLEMTAEQLVHRMVCSRADIESEKITRGSLSPAEFQKVVAAVNSMHGHTMVIDDQPGLKVTDLRSRARRMKERYDIQLLIIDYLQLLSGSNSSRNADSRQNEISEISRMLKTLARELNIPLLCLSQLSRKVEERTGHRPVMSDLRESGSIEQDADLVFFLLRPEYYDPHDRPGQAELIIAKNRHGSIGSVTLTFRKEVAQFANFAPIKSPDGSFQDEYAYT